MRPTARLGTFLTLLLLGCGSSPPEGDGGPMLPRSPDGLAYCCPIGVPSCDCQLLGGSSPSATSCRVASTCDAPPAAFHLETDEHGCPRYRIGTEGGSCFPGADAAP